MFYIIDVMNNALKNNIVTTEEAPAERIFRFIRYSNLKPGNKLPIREHLSEKLGLGPRVLREALSVLEYCGVIRTQSKAGTIITNPDTEKLETLLRWHLEFSGYELSDMIRARASIEAISAYEAAIHRTNRDLLVILVALEELEEKEEAKENDIEEEMEFHLSVLKATHNPVMTIFSKLISTNIRKTCGNSAFEASNAKKANNEHRQIYQAIKNKCSVKAMKLMHTHILSSMSIKTQTKSAKHEHKYKENEI